jgi:hypothetical protein
MNSRIVIVLAALACAASFIAGAVSRPVGASAEAGGNLRAEFFCGLRLDHKGPNSASFPQYSSVRVVSIVPATGGTVCTRGGTLHGTVYQIWYQ